MPESAKNSGTRWKLGIVLLIGVFLVGTAASLVTAARRVSRVVDTDYYSHGLHYGDTQDSSKNPGLGWSIAPELAGTQLQVRVRDASGAPVGGGTLSFEPQSGANSLQAEAKAEPSGAKGLPAGAWELAESSPGVFQPKSRVPPLGELRGMLRFTRGSAVASQKLVLFN